MFELYDPLCRKHWSRPLSPFPKNWHKYEPLVTIQVPTYSEPPEIVIDTLDNLSRIKYQNYEVMLIDNNTADPKLWQPVKEHCEKLGEKFRFYHIENLPGAKAGALNHFHKDVNPETEILAVVDADYIVEPDFLTDLVGHFQHPDVGFVQTPHDYRDWENNLFLKMCYWEYKLFFHTAMVTLNEYDAGITVGTMCLVRKKALEEAGGWSEWCVTEDSELAIRIHDLGYKSVYVSRTYGRGLIPETFEDYKKQRYRWTAGPVQEFREYFTHFLTLSKKNSKYHFVQRLFHLNHGLGNALNALNLPAILISLLLISSLIINNEIVIVPFEMWLAATISLFSSSLLVFTLYKSTTKATWRDIMMQSFATKALHHVVSLATIRTLLTGNAKWVRTNKFKVHESYIKALLSTKEEAVIGLLLIVYVIAAYTVFPHHGLSLMILIGMVYIATGYLSSTAMALIGAWSNKKS